MRWWWDPLCTRPTPYLDFYNASSLKQQSMDRHVAPTRTHYSDSEPISLCSYSLLLRVLAEKQHTPILYFTGTCGQAPPPFSWTSIFFHVSTILHPVIHRELQNVIYMNKNRCSRKRGEGPVHKYLWLWEQNILLWEQDIILRKQDRKKF